MSAKDYLRIIPQRLMRRAKKHPRVGRPWRTHSLCNLMSFHRNRFYEMDRWYKARIPPPIIFHECYPVDPNKIYKSLEQRLAEMNMVDPILHEKVEIGLPHQPISVSQEAIRKFRQQQRTDGELERAARHRKLQINIQEAETESWSYRLPQIIAKLAAHFNLYQDLFHEDSYFYPTIPMEIGYQFDEEKSGKPALHPVYYGNELTPEIAENPPQIRISAEKLKKFGDFFTLMLVNPDGNLYEENAEILHWMIANIPSGSADLASGDLLVEYLPPLPPKGTGYHRLCFVLFHQMKRMDFSGEIKKIKKTDPLDLRTFSMPKFYRKHEENLTPASLAWFQCAWDSVVSKTFHQVLKMREPLYEYEWPETSKPPQQEFAKKSAFDTYLDIYRSEKDIEKEVLQKRLKRISPFKIEEKSTKFPNVFREEEKFKYSSWLLERKDRERLGIGRYRGIYSNKLR